MNLDTSAVLSPDGPKSQHFKRSFDVVSRAIAGETIVVPICRGIGEMDSVFLFNPIGGEIWELLRESRGQQELSDWVAGHFDAGGQQLTEDIAAFLQELLEVGLIVSVQP